ncbi:MAG: Multidrug resistance protein MdtA [Candidatus Celerinatantimonas neptuna]|nr:MAG: Multidrug resistance protein MdtA [Candidatus Celerinatantimonas neptuna]
MTSKRVPSRLGKYRFPIVIIFVLIVIAGWFLWQHDHASSSKQQETTHAAHPGRRPHPGGSGPNQITSVYTNFASHANVHVYLHALGTVEANKTVTVTSRVTGELMKVFFTEGQFVKKGQRLAQIDDRSYRATLAQYLGELSQNKAQLKSAKLTLTRYRRLYQQKSLSEQDLQDQIASVGQYRGAVEADQAQVDSARLSIEYADIRSPISGYTGLLSTDTGNLVSADSTTIVTITQVNPIAVTFSLPQANIPDILAGLRHGHSFKVDAFNQTGNKQLASGLLKYMSNQIDTDTGTVKLKALFNNKNERLYPNQFVNIRLKLKTLKNAVVISKAALQLNDHGDFVFVVDKSSHVKKHLVKVGPSDGEDRVVILSGVKAGNQLVTTGIDNLSDGSKVQVITKNKAHS